MPEAKQENLIAGRYAPEARLGRGGMGEVWRAEDNLLRRKVALKQVEVPASIDDQAGKDVLTRVMREARAAARLSHRNAVTMFDVIQENGRAYIVMELVDAPTLSELVQREGPLPPERAARIGLALVDVLEAAHSAGIVHRDVKPGNVMVREGDDVKLADFGIASVKGDPKITATGLILGSPSYMAPEQARGESAGPEVDMWGLGATLYFAVEGVEPFNRGEAIPTLSAIVHDEPRPPLRAGPLEPLILSLLEKDPTRRASAARARSLLQEAVDGGAPTVRRNEADAPTTELAREEATSYPVAAPKIRGALIALGLVALALVALLAIPPLLRDDAPADGRGEGRGAATAPRQDEGGDEDAPAAENDESDAPDTSGVPEGWESYTHPDTGYRFAYPAGWEISGASGNAVDFRDPASGTYIRVDYIQPPGDDPVAAWEAQSESFAQRYADYQEIRIDAATYKGYEAAEWEYTYSGQHAINLGFVTDDYGFALNFVTAEAEWASSQDLFESFKNVFQAP